MKVELVLLVPVVSTLGHSPSTRLGVVASVGVLLWDSQTAQAQWHLLRHDSRQGQRLMMRGLEEGQTGGQISNKPSRMYGVQQPTQVRSRACGAAGDLKQSKAKQAKQNSTVILDAATVPLSIRPAHSLPRVWQFEGFHRTIHRTSIAFPITLSGHPLLLHRLTARLAPEGRQLHTSLCSLASLVHIIRQEDSVPDDRCAFISTADDLIANDPIALSSQPRAITGRWLFTYFIQYSMQRLRGGIDNQLGLPRLLISP